MTRSAAVLEHEEFSSSRTGLGQQHGQRFIVFDTYKAVVTVRRDSFVTVSVSVSRI